MGGLGNQMFQYALGTHLAIKNRADLKIDTTLLTDRTQPHEVVTHRSLEIDIFNVKLDLASQEEIWHFNGRTYTNLLGKTLNKLTWQFRKKNLIIETGRDFDPGILALSDNKCLVGAWQSEKYFKPVEAEIRKLYTFKQDLLPASLELGRQIRNANSVCVNVRRGDYVTSPIYRENIGALSAGYYSSGISFFENAFPQAEIYVFSDDVEWCKNNIRSKLPVHFVGHEHAGAKFGNYLQLMASCRHFVISNSTFAWWGAWLGEKKDSVIIAPGQWARDAKFSPLSIIPERWKKIPNEFEV